MFTKFGIMSGQKRDLTDHMSCNKETLFPALSCAFIHGDFFYLFIYLFIRWDDDVVFKNCAKGDDGKKKVRHFACYF